MHIELDVCRLSPLLKLIQFISGLEIENTFLLGYHHSLQMQFQFRYQFAITQLRYYSSILQHTLQIAIVWGGLIARSNSVVLLGGGCPRAQRMQLVLN